MVAPLEVNDETSSVAKELDSKALDKSFGLQTIGSRFDARHS